MVTPRPARTRAFLAANDDLPPATLQAPGLPPVTIAELALVEAYLGDLIADIIGGEPANDNLEKRDR